MTNSITRRKFLQLSGAGVLGSLLYACAPQSVKETIEVSTATNVPPTQPAETPTKQVEVVQPSPTAIVIYFVPTLEPQNQENPHAVNPPDNFNDILKAKEIIPNNDTLLDLSSTNAVYAWWRQLNGANKWPGATLDIAQQNFSTDMTEYYHKVLRPQGFVVKQANRDTIVCSALIKNEKEVVLGFKDGLLHFADPGLWDEGVEQELINTNAALDLVIGLDKHAYLVKKNEAGEVTHFLNTVNTPREYIHERWIPVKDGVSTQAWDPEKEKWVDRLPPLPDWASAFVADHDGIPEKIDGLDCYSTDIEIMVGGVEQTVHLILAEYDPATGEWIPSYRTLEDLLGIRKLTHLPFPAGAKLDVLFALNQTITEPKDAPFFIRDTSKEAQSADLARLDRTFQQFYNLLHTTYPPEQLASIRGIERITQAGFSGLVVQLGGEVSENNVVIDDINLKLAHGFMFARLGHDQDRLVIGLPFPRYMSTFWLGIDLDILKIAQGDYEEEISNQLTTNLAEIVAYCMNVPPRNREILGAAVLTEETKGAAAELAKGLVDTDAAAAVANSRGFDTPENMRPLFNGKIFWAHHVQKN